MTALLWPDEQTLIPDLLRSKPQARPVLDRFGLRGCGGPEGPAETLGYFARAHEVPAERLLRELRESLAAPSVTLPLADEQPSYGWADAIYRPFFKAGIAVVLTLGAVWGAWLLLRIAFHGEFSAAGIHDVNAHGHAQIFGWVGLFVMGFAYQAFPRFKHVSLVWPRLAMATLVMMLAGIVVRSLAQPLAGIVEGFHDWLAVAAVSAAVLETAAIVIFALIIGQTWRTSGKPLTYYDGYIVSALAWFIVQAIYEAIYLAATLGAAPDRLIDLVATWQAPMRDVQIHGFTLLMILGVSQRIFHHIYGLPEPSPRLSRAMLVVLNVAVVGEVVGLVLMRLVSHAWAPLWYLSALALAVATTALVGNWRIYSKAESPDRSLKFLRTAYLWLLVSLAMLVLLPAYQFGALALLAPESESARIGFSHAYYGAIRHAITVGFASLMIVGVAAKVVPTLNGIHARRLSALWLPFVLINLGCAMRVVGQTLTDFVPQAFVVAGASGLLEVTGLALWGTHLWLVMSGRPGLRKETRLAIEENLPDGGPIFAAHTVGGVLKRHPELLDVFLAHGFSTLTSPQFRETIARVVTLEQACRRTGVDLQTLLDDLNERRDPAEKPPCHCCSQGRSQASEPEVVSLEMAAPKLS